MTLHCGVFFHFKSSHCQNHQTTQRVSPRVSEAVFKIEKRKKGAAGSVTVEAALAAPIFFFAIVSLFYIMEVTAVRTAVRGGMQYACREYAQKAYGKPTVSASELENAIVRAVGDKRLDRSIVVNGSRGISCRDSDISAASGILKLRVSYKVRLPIPAFQTAGVTIKDSMKVKGWTGYVKNGFDDSRREIVYITENGSVYHRSSHCPYLDLSIRAVHDSGIKELRNKNHGRYKPCESCAGKKSNGLIYITDYGDRWHSSLGCSGLKRTVYAIPISEAIGKGECSKCGK